MVVKNQNHKIWIFLIVCLCFAVNAAVNSLFTVRKAENMLQFLLNGGDAPGIFAFEHIGKLLGQAYGFLVKKLAVLDKVESHSRVNIADYIEVNGDIGINLDYILLAHFAGMDILDNGDGAIELVETEKLIKPHTAAGSDVVYNYAVLN